MNNASAFHDEKFLSKNDHPKELFLSSDANAVVEHTKKVLVIEDGEVVHLKVRYFILIILLCMLCILRVFPLVFWAWQVPYSCIVYICFVILADKKLHIYL